MTLSFRTTTRYDSVPDIAIRTILNPDRGWISVVVPVARQNLVQNPSLETNSTGWALAGSATIARTTDYQAHGAYSLAVTPSSGGSSDGCYYGTVSLTSGTTYAVSVKLRGVAGRSYVLAVANTSGTTIQSITVVATGRWQWVTGLFYTESSTTTRRVYITRSGTGGTIPFYVDGLQVEACTAGAIFATTYLDGDQAGLIPNQYPPPFSWDGTPHASTSRRSAQTRAGGQVINLDDLGMLVTDIAGLGIPTPDARVLPYGQADGAQFQTIQVPPRTFQLIGYLDGGTFADAMRSRNLLSDAFAIDSTGQRQPLVLIIEPYECLIPYGDAGQIICSYIGGLEGQMGNPGREDVTISFTAWQPFLTGYSGGAATTSGAVITTYMSRNLAQRQADGTWSNVGGGANGIVYALARLDNALYAGGAFTAVSTADAVAAARVAKWDGSAWSALGTGLNNTCYALAVAPNGDLYAGGDFTTAGGGAANRIAKWNGSAWSALGTGLNSTCRAIAIDSNGNVYALGDFTTAGGGAAVRIAMWNGSAWSALGSGLNNTGYALVCQGTTVYVGGLFTTAGGIAANYIAKWNGTAWSILSTGMNSTVLGLTIGADQQLYAVGFFSTAGGSSAAGAASWNGVGWSALGSGIGGTDCAGQAVAAIAVGGVVVATNSGSGYAPTVGGVYPAGTFGIWTGSTWVWPDIGCDPSLSPHAFDLPSSGILTIAAYNPTFDSTPALITATHQGSAVAYPVITWLSTGASNVRIYQIENLTTGATIYLNVTILPSERITLNLQPDQISLVSNFRGNITGLILQGSNTDTFGLIQGAQTLGVLMASNTGVTTIVRWQTTYQRLDDLVWV